MQPESRDSLDPSSPPATVADAAEIARRALADLGAIGEEIEDEWQYVQDLVDAWDGRVAAIADARGDEPLPDAIATAVVMLAGEAGRITDPHRAIDWLSTFPQAVVVALGEPP